MLFLYILLIILILLIIPIPIKFMVAFDGENLEVYILKFKIFSLKEKRKKKEKKVEKEKKVKKQKKYGIDTVKRILHRIYSNPIKLKIKLFYEINYSTGDAANTAISYGILYQLITLVNLIINIPLKITLNSVQITPDFDAENAFVKFKIKSIFFLNLVKIIYMLLLILFSLKQKEVDPKGESYGM